MHHQMRRIRSPVDWIFGFSDVSGKLHSLIHHPPLPGVETHRFLLQLLPIWHLNLSVDAEVSRLLLLPRVEMFIFRVLFITTFQLIIFLLICSVQLSCSLLQVQLLALFHKIASFLHIFQMLHDLLLDPDNFRFDPLISLHDFIARQLEHHLLTLWIIQEHLPEGILLPVHLLLLLPEPQHRWTAPLSHERKFTRQRIFDLDDWGQGQALLLLIFMTPHQLVELGIWTVLLFHPE